MSGNPLFEVFGFPVNDVSEVAMRHRNEKLCPFNNKVSRCTKDKAGDPLGVCSIMDGDSSTIICPVRFRQGWRIADDAAEFFGFSPGSWSILQEVRLNDKNGRSAGIIDLVVVERDEVGNLIDFGSVEVQAVYISGNVRQPFEHYMETPEKHWNMNWTATQVRADYLSSSRKRLMPQLVYKGEILKAWGKKQVVAIHKTFFETLPKPPTVPREEAEMAWFIYDLLHNAETGGYDLGLVQTVYTEFAPALLKITSPEPGSVDGFVESLQRRLDRDES